MTWNLLSQTCHNVWLKRLHVASQKTINFKTTKCLITNIEFWQKLHFIVSELHNILLSYQTLKIINAWGATIQTKQSNLLNYLLPTNVPTITLSKKWQSSHLQIRKIITCVRKSTNDYVLYNKKHCQSKQGLDIWQPSKHLWWLRFYIE